MSLSAIGGGIIVVVLTLLGAFFGGRREGKISKENDQLKDEQKLRQEYEKIDHTSDVADPFSLL